jgi:predicted peptidase
MTLFVSLLLLVAAAAPDQSVIVGPPPLDELMKPEQIEFESGKSWQYRLHIPQQLENGESYTLVVWLHGEGQSGDDNRIQLRHLEETLLTAERREHGCRMFILAPQKPKGVPWHGAPASPPDALDMLDVVTKMIEKTSAEHPIDPSRIIVMGLSSGSGATWAFGARYPDMFAAALPFACGPSEGSIAGLVSVPVWAFHSPKDTMASPEASEQAVNELSSLGGLAAFTLSSDFPEATSGLPAHSCWASAFRDYNLYDWLLAQSMGSGSAPPPGRAPEDVMQYVWALGAVVVATIVLAPCYAEIRRYHRQSLMRAEALRYFEDSTDAYRVNRIC